MVKTRLRLVHRDREHYGNTRHAEKLREGRPLRMKPWSCESSDP